MHRDHSVAELSISLGKYGFNQVAHCNDDEFEILPQSWRFIDNDPVFHLMMQRINDRANNLTGILVAGPSGSGKTHFVECIKMCCVSSHSLMNLDCADLVMKEVGASEKKLLTLFEEAQSQEPCIITLENLDILFSNHDLEIGPMLRIQNSLLECFDSFVCSSQLLVVATATNSEYLGSIFLRKGRFDFVINRELPTLQDVESTVTIFLKSLGADEISCDMIRKLSLRLGNRHFGCITSILARAVFNAKLNGLMAGHLKHNALISILGELEKLEIN